ncbi:MAG: signal peptidase I [Thermoleophilia bacterium]|nr:signal peptidase I [Thermoleophilia bacterium]
MAAAAATPRGPRPARRAARALGRSLRALWFVARVVLVVAAVGVAIAWHRYGYAPVAVQTGSMAPTYPVHTLLFVHDAPAGDVRVGDVITFDPPGRVPRTTHRVVRRTLHAGQWYFETKGDANPVADDWRQANTPSALAKQPYLRGIAYSNGTAVRTEGHLPYAGWFAELGGMPKLRHALIAFPFIIIALQLLQWIWSAGGSGTNGPRRSDDDDDGDVATPHGKPERAAA